MIVDVHYHLFTFNINETSGIANFLGEECKRIAKIMGIDETKENLIKKGIPLWSDIQGDKLIKRMDEAGIDFSVVCVVDDINAHSDEIQHSNKNVSDIANKYPERLTAFAGIDPRRPDALDMLKQCFEEYGMTGLKYHPDYGYDPSGKESYILLDYLERNNGILLTHTGPLPRQRSKYSDPMLLADILADFSKLKVIAAHMGQINWRPWAALASLNSNLYGDLSMWGPYAFGKFELFCRELRDIIDYVGVEKILFGSDSPVYDVVLPVKDLIEKIKKLPYEAPQGICFTKGEIDAILGVNAAKLLNL